MEDGHAGERRGRTSGRGGSLATVSSTSGLASKTFSRKRFPSVTSVTGCGSRRGRMAKAALSAGERVGAVEPGA